MQVEKIGFRGTLGAMGWLLKFFTWTLPAKFSGSSPRQKSPHSAACHGFRCMTDKKAKLTLTNPHDPKACGKLLQFDVKTSCRQLNDLSEVMQQPLAPSGEWYWRILLENSVFSPPRTCLTAPSGGTPWDINIIYTPLKITFSGLQFCRRHYGFSFI